MPKSVYMSDVARECGVSKRSVSFALDPDPQKRNHVSPLLLAKIQATAQRLGYRPNRTVRQFMQRRHGMLGIISSAIWDISHFTMSSLLSSAQNKNLVLLLEEMPKKSCQDPLFLRENCVDGVIAFGPVHGDWYQKLSQLDIPVMEVNTNHRTGPLCITYDEEGAARQIMQLMKQNGVGRAAFVYYDREFVHYSVAARLEGLRKAAAELGAPPPLAIPIPYKKSTRQGDAEAWQEAERCAAKLFAQKPDQAEMPEWVILNDEILVGLFCRTAAAAGRRIASDINFITFAHLIEFGFQTQPVSAMVLSFDDLGAQIIARMEAAIHGDRQVYEPLRIGYRLAQYGLMPGSTTGVFVSDAENAGKAMSYR